jgi:hypothetical protein
LFGTSRAGAESAPGCDKDGCGAVRSGHGNSMKGDSGLLTGHLVGLAHRLYHAGGLKTERFPIAVGKAVFAAVHLHI